METMGRPLTALLTALRYLGPLLLSATLWGQQYKADKAGAPPPEVAASISQALDPKGFQISAQGGPYCELWLRERVPAGPALKEQNVTLPGIPMGTLLGVIRFDSQGSDRRGQTIQPGVYTLRYGIMPANGSHEGAAPQRDFLLLVPAAEDRDLNAIPSFDSLVAMSRKASRTPHPAVLSFWKADADSPGFSQQGDTDWVLQSKVGDIPIAIIVVGTTAG
jgi:hypothetical protein